jgi:hypothetical protein
MGVIKKQQDEFLIYEELELGILVAIKKTDQSLIKRYWKTKDKSSLEATTVPGFPFIQTEEQESLKIDFSEIGEYEISQLKKFD